MEITFGTLWPITYEYPDLVPKIKSANVTHRNSWTAINYSMAVYENNDDQGSIYWGGGGGGGDEDSL